MSVPGYVANTAQQVGDRILVANAVYQCTTAGENAGALTGNETGTGITDGGAVWSYLSPKFVQIALRNDLARWSTQVDLDDQTVTLKFAWNVRMSSWFLTVYDEPAINVLVGDRRCVVGYPIPASFSARQPPGLFAFLDTSGQQKEPGLTDLGGRVQLVYLTAAGLGL